MNSGITEARDPQNRPVPDDGFSAPKPQPLPRTLRRALLWTAAGVAVAICVAILLLWGIHGPTYIFDLIAAYCF
jgi:uncharacterized membrane protein YbhN (UPF0104 family)